MLPRSRTWPAALLAAALATLCPAAVGDDDPSRRGFGHAARFDWTSAAAAFEEAVAADPEAKAPRINLAIARLRAGEPEAALTVLEPLDETVDVGRLTYLRGLALRAAGRPREALDILAIACERAPTDAAVLFQHAILLEQNGELDVAEEFLERVVELDRLHISAHYRLSRILRRQQETEAARVAQLRFERAKAIAGDDAQARQAAERFGETTWTELIDQPPAWQPPEAPRRSTMVRVEPRQRGGSFMTNGIAIVDVNGDGEAELLRDGRWSEQEAETQLWKWGGAPIEALAPRVEGPGVGRGLPGDFDNDGVDDLVGSAVLRGLGGGVFRSMPIDLPERRRGHWIDVDQDGDLDLLTSWHRDTRNELPPVLLRNRGDGTFEEDLLGAGFPASVAPRRPQFGSDPHGLTTAEINDDDAIDVIVAGDPGGVLFNGGFGAFDADELPPVPLPDAVAVAADDIDNDGQIDVAWLTPRTAEGGCRVRFSSATIPDIVSDLPGVAGFERGTDQLFLADVDADGFLDVLLACHADEQVRLQLWRNRGPAGWTDVTASAGLDAALDSKGATVLVGDLDADGDADIVADLDGAAFLLFRNDLSRPANALRLRLQGAKSNRSGLGTRLDIRAGEARIFRTVHRLPLVIPTGDHDVLDVVRIIWPNGVTDALFDVPTNELVTALEPQVMLGSCPYLYVHDGPATRFVTDILGNSPLGLPLRPGQYIPADTDDLLALGADRDFAHPPTSTGRLRATITDELPEVVYLDQATLWVADAPPEVELHPTDAVRPPPHAPSALVAVADVTPPTRALLDGADVTELVTRRDLRHASPPELAPWRRRGFAAPYTITVAFDGADLATLDTLVVNGWLQWGDAAINVGAAQQPSAGDPWPVLEAEVDGVWRRIDVVVGAPAGKTKSIVCDLRGALPAGAKRLRLLSALELHWDRIALGRRVETPPITRLAPASAELRERGVSMIDEPRPDLPLTPRFDELDPSPPWRSVPSGWHTSLGDVRPLLAALDDELVVMTCGDAVELLFDTSALPAPAAGADRRYFLWVDGWDKDSNVHVRHGNTAHPLPFHGMDDQRYGERRSPARLRPWLHETLLRFVPSRFPR